MAFLVYDDIFLQHDTGPHHPECPERLAQMTDHLRECGLWDRLTHFAPRRATAKEIDRVHAPGHLDRMRAACLATGNIDEDTRVGSYSFEAAMNAAGATLVAADAVMKGDERRGFCLVRPPGHHATSDRAMGFCLLNNVAVCAAYLLDRHGVERVAIVDIDVHHGNGTEEIFGADDRVFYLSLHRSPFYPSTGRAEDGGETLLNVPLPADTTPERWHEAFHGAMARVEAFAPEVLIVSTGFDAHRTDPIGGLGLRTEDYRRISERLVDSAERTAGGRIISVLEGGYNLAVLGPCLEAHLAPFLAEEEVPPRPA